MIKDADPSCCGEAAPAASGEEADEQAHEESQPCTSAQQELDEASIRAQRDKGLLQHGCKHYRRRCKMVAPCCGEIFWCRHCHNEVKTTNEWVRLHLSAPLSYGFACCFGQCQRRVASGELHLTKGWTAFRVVLASKPSPEHLHVTFRNYSDNRLCCLQDPSKRHELDRTTVRELVCALCDLRQPVASMCTGCGIEFGAYCCLKCCFFDDDLKKLQFHCKSCGICRVGGADNFFHCDTCGCCYAKSLEVTACCWYMQ